MAIASSSASHPNGLGPTTGSSKDLSEGATAYEMPWYADSVVRPCLALTRTCSGSRSIGRCSSMTSQEMPKQSLASKSLLAMAIARTSSSQWVSVVRRRAQANITLFSGHSWYRQDYQYLMFGACVAGRRLQRRGVGIECLRRKVKLGVTTGTSGGSRARADTTHAEVLTSCAIASKLSLRKRLPCRRVATKSSSLTRPIR